MTTAAAIDWTVAIVLFLLALLALGLCRAAGRGSRAEEAVYDGPDSLRLIEDLDAHMKAYGEQVADLYDTRGNRP